MNDPQLNTQPKLEPIPIPWKSHLQEFRFRYLPPVVFGLTLVGVSLLWPKVVGVGPSYDRDPASQDPFSGITLPARSEAHAASIQATNNVTVRKAQLE
jgi:hypothetical protein